MGPTGPTGTNFFTRTGADVYYNAGNFGLGTTTPAYTLDVSGISRTTGIMVGGSNSLSLAYTTPYTRYYSYFQQVNTTSNVSIVFNLNNIASYVKIVAMAMEQSNANNISTLVLEATGGHMFAGNPSNNMKVITSSITTNGTFAWNNTITTSLASITVSTATASATGYYFNLRVETFGGTAKNITINGSIAISFNY